jgi:anti-sigma factor RsiW
MKGEVSPEQKRELEQHVATCKDCGAFHKVAYEITCCEVTKFLDEYIEGRLAPDRCAVFERHLAICDECKAYLASYRRTIALSKAAFEDTGAVGLELVPDGLVRAILDARKKK